MLAFLAAGMGALAQPAPGPTESVTVTGERARDEQIKSFVESRAAPTRLLGKIARWESGICPVATGLKPEFLKFIVQRVKDVAARVSAPVNPSPSCTTNIEIVFTTRLQAVLDGLRKDHADYLGVQSNSDQVERSAHVTHSIQAWYATSTIDTSGIPQVDSRRRPGFCLDLPVCLVYIPTGATYHASGTRLNDSLRSAISNVIIVADSNKLNGGEAGALADYIAFLALAQPRALDDCADLPSILNLLAPDCAAAASTRAISDGDIGYLRGLYHMTPDATLRAQQDEIAFQMKQTLDGK